MGDTPPHEVGVGRRLAFVLILVRFGGRLGRGGVGRATCISDRGLVGARTLSGQWRICLGFLGCRGLLGLCGRITASRLGLRRKAAVRRLFAGFRSLIWLRTVDGCGLARNLTVPICRRLIALGLCRGSFIRRRFACRGIIAGGLNRGLPIGGRLALAPVLLQGR
jgi:hypothetical protein